MNTEKNLRFRMKKISDEHDYYDKVFHGIRLNQIDFQKFGQLNEIVKFQVVLSLLRQRFLCSSMFIRLMNRKKNTLSEQTNQQIKKRKTTDEAILTFSEKVDL